MTIGINKPPSTPKPDVKPIGIGERKIMEYMIFKLAGIPLDKEQQLLNKFGNDGWQLVTILEITKEVHKYYFIRTVKK